MAQREPVVSIDIVPMGDPYTGSWDEYVFTWPDGQTQAVGDGQPAYWVLSNLLEFVAGEKSRVEFTRDLIFHAQVLAAED